MAPKILIYGYGNPGRQDDSLGIMLTEELEKWCKEKNLTNVKTDMNYQLNIEDVITVSQSEIVFFVDASREAIGAYKISEVVPTDKVNFTMHEVSPGYIIELCNNFYGYAPQSWLLQIKGYEWNFMEPLSSKAKQNLTKCSAFLKNCIENYNFNY
ncbi:MAG: hydrogenase maturation protease [Bacteroidota bacterium]